MALSTTDTSVEYSGNNSTVASYTIPFQFLAASHLVVKTKASGGDWVTLTSGQYTVTQITNGTGTLRTASAVPTSSLVRIERHTPALQSVVLPKSSVDPYAVSIGKALDAAMMLHQERGPDGPPSWDTLAGKPSTFPPATHNHDSAYGAKSKEHEHANIGALGKITESAGYPLWNGSAWPGGGGGAPGAHAASHASGGTDALTLAIAQITGLAAALSARPVLTDGKLSSEVLPSYVDDIIMVANYAALPATGEAGKIYVTEDTNEEYRWTGSAYVAIQNPLDYATQEEAEAGIDDTKVMTAARVAQAIAYVLASAGYQEKNGTLALGGFSNITGEFPGTNIASGSVSNGKLANSTIAINGVNISLGGSVSGLQTTAGTLALGGFAAISGSLPSANLPASTLTPIAITKGILTASAPTNESETWNNAAVLFKGKKLSVTDTASLVGSWLSILELGSKQIGFRKIGSALGLSLGASADSHSDAHLFTDGTSGFGAQYAYTNGATDNWFWCGTYAGVMRHIMNAAMIFGWSQYTTALAGGSSAYIDAGFKRSAAGIVRVIGDASGSTYGFVEDLYRRKGTGSPEGVVTAPVSCVYHRTDGGAGTSFYVKESGSGNTGWVAK